MLLRQAFTNKQARVQAIPKCFFSIIPRKLLEKEAQQSGNEILDFNATYLPGRLVLRSIC